MSRNANRRSVLVSGMGIAGPTLAWWLARYGWSVTLVERAPCFRRGGYMIDFWGNGYDVAERMRLLGSLHRRGYDVREVRFVDDDGERVGGFDAAVMREALSGRFVSLLRGDLADEIYHGVRDRAELVFDDEIASLRDDGRGVDVELARGGARRFDVVIGADGLHSRVRELAFAPPGQCERYLGYCAAAFTTWHYAARNEGVYVGHGFPGHEAFRFGLRDGRTVFFLVFASAQPPPVAHSGVAVQKAMLLAEYADMRWEWRAIARALAACDDLYFDTVTQVRMKGWHRGRIGLVGDAAFCPSLLAGEGASLAMTAGYVLARELARCEDAEQAFGRYERLLAPLLRRKQDSARRFGKWFAPRTRLGMAVRDIATGALAIPIVGRAMARFMLTEPRVAFTRA